MSTSHISVETSISTHVREWHLVQKRSSNSLLWLKPYLFSIGTSFCSSPEVFWRLLLNRTHRNTSKDCFDVTVSNEALAADRARILPPLTKVQQSSCFFSLSRGRFLSFVWMDRMIQRPTESVALRPLFQKGTKWIECMNTSDGAKPNTGYFLLMSVVFLCFMGGMRRNEGWTGRGAGSYMIPALLPHLVSSPNQSQTPFITHAARRLSSITLRTKAGDKDARMQTQMLGCTWIFTVRRPVQLPCIYRPT